MEPNIASLASLIGDSARAKMLTALMCGKALTATELAAEADITSQTASSHLSKLVNGQLLIVRKQGRHRYFQLKSHQIAGLIETLLNIAADTQHLSVRTGPADPRLRKSRICYDHLAGEIGVSLYDSLIRNEIIVDSEHVVTLSEKGREFFGDLGADLYLLEKSKRPLCKSCLDWSERRSHLSGSIGKWILSDLLEKSWATRNLDSRVIQFTQSGLAKFNKIYEISDSY